MFRKIRKYFLLGLLLLVAFVGYSNYSVDKAARGNTFDKLADMPKNKVGMVLGTSKMLANGNINLYFQYRIDATVELFENGLIEFVLVSGDNGNKYYDEPNDFKDELVKRGIPENKIFLDYAGFRTLDSIVRAKKIFGLDTLTIISQKFHNERAVYLAEENDMVAVGYNAKDVSLKSGIKTQIREVFARTKAFIDVKIGVEPKYLGELVEIR